ncbi:hypothetical protein [Phytohabitans rumicis]|uniref:Uncharacterized protein n=1 Tax=Phytohabitans rumicis TaxID=1076125 RepID=A0A6V8L5W9_9ACTN|nr:hypothetical protein [Phytohabitans rumicis]GFJ92643.1 hypothetical protein Prum_062850 [Phytohabitans rumicis]
MRTYLAIAAGSAAGAFLAVIAAFALISANAPDQDAERLINSGQTSAESTLQYGQR